MPRCSETYAPGTDDHTGAQIGVIGGRKDRVLLRGHAFRHGTTCDHSPADSCTWASD